MVERFVYQLRRRLGFIFKIKKIVTITSVEFKTTDWLDKVRNEKAYHSYIILIDILVKK